MKPVIVLPVLFTLVFASALAIPHVVHSARKQVDALQVLRNEQLLLEEDWGRLLLEESTWGNYARVERVAVEQLRMREPDFLNVGGAR